MKTKSGVSIPVDLAKALSKDKGTQAMWDRLRPSCQKTHVEYLSSAVKPETRGRRIERVLKMTADYCRQHEAKK
jgi:uncharacterized protein YdeI (YjbR/CyaY-like superfamily)